MAKHLSFSLSEKKNTFHHFKLACCKNTTTNPELIAQTVADISCENCANIAQNKPEPDRLTWHHKCNLWTDNFLFFSKKDCPNCRQTARLDATILENQLSQLKDKCLFCDNEANLPLFSSQRILGFKSCNNCLHVIEDLIMEKSSNLSKIRDLQKQIKDIYSSMGVSYLSTP